MAGVPTIPLAVLLNLVSTAPEKPTATSKAASRAGGPAAPVPEHRELVAFLQMNPEEKFDLEAINSIDTHALVEEIRNDRRLLREVVRTAEALLPRVTRIAVRLEGVVRI